jgi:hypothetical protein
MGFAGSSNCDGQNVHIGPHEQIEDRQPIICGHIGIDHNGESILCERLGRDGFKRSGSCAGTPD